MPGPPPVPVERKRARGNPGKQKLPDTTATAAVPELLDAPPDHLGPLGTEVWRRALTLGSAWIGATDRQLLTRYCEALDDREHLRAYVAEHGLTVTGSQDQEVLSPHYKALSGVEALLLRMESLLGFTPADRSRIGVAEVKKESRLEAFRRARGG